MYFQIPFLIFYLPFLFHPLTSIGNFDIRIIYHNDNVIIYLTIINIYIQLVDSFTYVAITWMIRNAFSCGLDYPFSLSIWWMKRVTYIPNDKNKRIWKFVLFAFLIFIHPFKFIIPCIKKII